MIHTLLSLVLSLSVPAGAPCDGDCIYRRSYEDCPPDFNQDGGVDGQDIADYLQAWSDCYWEDHDANINPDLDGDGQCTDCDLCVWLFVWEQGFMYGGG